MKTEVRIKILTSGFALQAESISEPDSSVSLDIAACYSAMKVLTANAIYLLSCKTPVSNTIYTGMRSLTGYLCNFHRSHSCI